MAPPSLYDPSSPDEQTVSLPSAPPILVSENVILQPPLTRRGGLGPILILLLPPKSTYAQRDPTTEKPLDPEPVQKWAEEGFSVIGVTVVDQLKIEEYIDSGLHAFFVLSSGGKKLAPADLPALRVDAAIIAYEKSFVSSRVFSKPPVIHVRSVHKTPVHLVGLSIYHSTAETAAQWSELGIPVYIHAYRDPQADSLQKADSLNVTLQKYDTTSPHFVLPDSEAYHPGNASMAHTRTLVFLRKILDGPHFDLEAIWEEHTYFEFEVRSVAKTMGTMVAEPYVNHVPTMTGGIGRKNLSEFYRDHFIFSNPADAVLQPVSRTVGPDRVVDEFIFTLTHTKMVDWLLPGVPPTGKKLAIPMLAVVNIRGDRLYHEHIWWDQGTAMLQAGILPSHVPFPLNSGGTSMLKLPVAGQETARLLANETDGKSNEMFEWGVAASEQ